VLVQDGAGWHGSAGLAVPDNITLITLPPSSPELNPIENIWEYLRKDLFATYEDIVEACCDAWNVLIAMPDRIASITQRSWAKVS
jgi:transposase